MKVDEELARMSEEIKRIQKRRRWLKKHKAQLEQLPDATFCGNQVDFDNLKHPEVIKVVRGVGGKFKKEAGIQVGTVNYIGELDGMTVRCWHGQPPPSCRLIEVEEYVPEQVIPAKTVKRIKMVCTPDPAAQIAIARQPQPTATPVV